MGIALFDQKSVGRNFQLAALSAVYNQVSQKVRRAIDESLSSGELSLDSNDLQELGETLADFLTQVCGQRSYYPSLYKAGPRGGDRKILDELGIINPKSNAYCNDLIDYSKNVKNKDLSKVSSIPMFVRAYIFSKYRDVVTSEGRGAKKDGDSKEKAEAGSIWLAFAGAYISLVSKIRIIHRASGNRPEYTKYDIYVIPDGTLTSIGSASNFYGLIYSQKVEVRLWEILGDIYEKKLSISPEISMWLSTLIHVVQDEALAVKLSGDKGYESLIITRILSNNRPQVVWSSVLSLSRYIESLKKHNALYIMNYLGYMIRNLGGLKGDEDRRHAEAALVTCVNELFKYLEAKDSSSLAVCSSVLVRAYSNISDERYAKNIRGLLEGVAKLA